MITTRPARPDHGGAGPGQAGAGGPVAASDWRRVRAPAALVALILLGGVVIALLQLGPPVTGPFDPNDTGPLGAHALAALLTNRGQTVIRAGTVAAASSAASRPRTTLVITSPARLTPSQLTVLAGLPAGLLIVAPGRGALRALAPGVTLVGTAPVRSEPPACGLPGASLAGDAEMGGLLLRSAAPGAWQCYPTPGSGPGGGYPSLVRYTSGGRVITVLSTGIPLTNSELARDGNAALALNLLNSSPRVVWLVPGPATGAGLPAGRGPRSLWSLVPRPVYLLAAELGIAVLLAALWRMRRFGPLVAEPLPVTVRAAETVEGHGRLYQSRRARDRAAAALRAATLDRITSRLGLPRDVPPGTVCEELARRSGRGQSEIRGILFGPVPGDDAALVTLAADLESLEGQVLNR